MNLYNNFKKRDWDCGDYGTVHAYLDHLSSPVSFLLPPTPDREPSPEEDEAGKYTLRQRVRSEDPKKLRTTLKAAQRMALSRQVCSHDSVWVAMVMKCVAKAPLILYF